MKKQILFLATGLLASLAVSCQMAEEQAGQDPAAGMKTVRIGARGRDTKTAYQDDKTFSWTAGDDIAVYCTDATLPSNNGFYRFSTTESGPMAYFTGDIPETAEVGAVALYPYSSAHAYKNGQYSFSVDGEKSYLARQSADIPMYGVASAEGVFDFTHLAGAFKLSVDGIPAGVTQVKVTFTAAGARMSGLFAVTGSGPYTWAAAQGESVAERTVVRYCPVSEGAFSVYIPYPDGTIWGNSSLLIQDYTGGTVGATLCDRADVGAIPVARSRVTRLEPLTCGYQSAFGVNWAGVAEARNTDATYPGIGSLKATMDPSYFYILLEVNKDALTLTDDYDHYLHFFLGDGSGSTGYWGTDKYKELKAIINGSSKDTNGWAVRKGVPSFSLSSNREFTSAVTTLFGNVYYELRIPRNASMYAALAQTDSPVKLGVILDDTKYNESGSPQYGHIYSPEKKVGIIPTRGSALYEVPQYTPPAAVVVTEPVNVDRVYHESLTETVNPERGMYKHNEYKYSGGGTYSSSVTCPEDKTLVLTIFYLADYATQDHLDAKATTAVGAVLDNVRKAGKKAIVRFAYNWDKNTSPRDASVQAVQNHIEDLATVLDTYKDVIYVFQAGFIGTYGEWYYTDSQFPKPSLSGNAVTNYANRAAVLDKLLEVVPEGIQIALRTPYYKNYYLHPSSVSTWEPISAWDGTSANARLTFHNDAFLADANDMGTFKQDYERQMWMSQGAWMVTGGETGFVEAADVNPAYCELDAALTTMRQYHYSYLNDAISNNEIVKYWAANGYYPTIRKRLGYRLVLDSAKISAPDLRSGSTVEVQLTISNTGSASLVYPRPCQLVVLHEGTPTVLKDMGALYDIRDIAPDGSHTYSFSVTLAQDVYAGDKLAIWMPDKTPALQDRAAYSVCLSNSDITWEEGYNVICTF